MSTESAFDCIRRSSDCANVLLRLARSLFMCRDFQIAPLYLSQITTVTRTPKSVLDSFDQSNI